MWIESNDGFDVTATFLGVTQDLDQLLGAIHSRGWEVTKVKQTNTGYEAEAKNPTTGQKLKKPGVTQETAVSHLLVALTRLDFIRSRWSRHHLGMWQTTFTDRLPEIAQAYAKAVVYDPKAVPAWLDLANDSTRRFQVLGEQLKIEVVDNPQPYSTPQEMCEDIRKNKHFYVSRANSKHPVWTVDQNVAFRTVHDVLGHCASGGDFGWQGENLACAAHFPLLDPIAQKALFTECIAQTAYAIYYRAFHPNQKVVFLDDIFEEHQNKENPPGFAGTHPSQSLAPTETPQIPPSTPENQISPYPEGWGFQPHVEDAINSTAPGGTGVFSRIAAVLDPNAGWESGMQPTPRTEDPVSGAGYTDWGDPLGWNRENPQGLTARDMTRRLDTGWANLVNPDGTPNRPLMKKAIVNAFATVLLSPRKDLRWNAIHYQHLADLAHLSSDPNDYHRKLEQERVAWNAARKIPVNAHKVYYQAERDYARYLQMKHPEWTPQEALARAEGFVRILLEDEKRKIADELEVKEANKPEEKRTTTSQIEIKAGQMVKKHLEDVMNPKFDPETDFAPQEAFHFASQWFGSQWFGGQSVIITDGPYAGQRSNDVRDYHGSWIVTLPSGQQIVLRSNQMKVDPTTEDFRSNQKEWPEDWDKHSLIPDTDLRTAAQIHPPGQVSLQSEDVDPTVTDLFNGAVNPEDMGAYGAWMGDHLKAVAAISKRADEVLDAALEDVHEHDAAGHHFRAVVLSMQLPGVGPKVCSFAWLLLQPMTSQLATIDTHMMDVLGYEPEQMNNRDYFRFERELAARRDASGYGHVPLGPFQWAMWDYKRTGPDTHQDHSAMRVLDPLDHNLIDWNAKATNVKGKKWKSAAPDWWKATDPAAEQVAQHFNDTIGTQYPQNEYPFRETPVMAPVMASTKKFEDNYVDELAEKIMDECSEDEIPDGESRESVLRLFRAYALLALTKGKDTTMEDVHDAWAAWTAERDGDHESLVPFDELSKKIQNYDRPYMEYIHKHSAETPSDELHVEWGLPQNVKNEIANWVATLEWPEGTEFEDPHEYHVTALYCHGGWGDERHHKWIKQHRSTNVPFKAVGIDEFGTDPDSKAIVIRLESPEAAEQANRLMDRAEDEGLEASRFPGGYKPHVTVAHAPSKPRGAKIQLQFRGTDLHISRPRVLREEEEGRHLAALGDPAPAFSHEDGTDDVGAPGETNMQHLRGFYRLPPEAIWAMPGLTVGKAT